jgi:putative AlgH/UPF0301 family transcriptional regulator
MGANDWQEGMERQGQLTDELESHLWYSLNQLKGHVSAETYEKAAKELGFIPEQARPQINESITDCAF